MTPLASIVGSGFLVMMPLLAGITSTLAGDAIRFNILNDGFNPAAHTDAIARPLERLLDVALAFRASAFF